MTPSWLSMYSYYQRLPKHPDGEYFSCAIRLSMCLHHTGAFNKNGYKKCRNEVSPHGWAMVAEQLYQWLRRHELGEAGHIPVSASDRSQLPRQNGIIYLRNCWSRRGEASRSGDHLDLYMSGHGLLSAILWPSEFPEGPFAIMGNCLDGNIRFWPAR